MGPIDSSSLMRWLREAGAPDRSALPSVLDAMRIARGLPPRSDTPDPLRSRLVDRPLIRRALERDDALGAFSQALSAPALEAAYRATTLQKRKFKSDEIATVTQLFTPRWVVEFLLQNSLGRLWLEMYPKSPLRKSWRWMLNPPARAIREPRPIESITLLDPACGTMNFGLVAIEMFQAMYAEQGAGGPVRNVFGIDIDPTAIELAHASIEMRFGARAAAHLTTSDALFADLPTDWPKRFDVVATNPPYLSARNLERATVDRMKRRYPAAWRDQYACFIERAMELLAPEGRAALLTMQSFMFTAGFEELRSRIAERTAIETIAHFGPGLFDVGNPGTLQTVAFVLHRGEARDAVRAVRLVDADDKARELRRNRKRPMEVSQADLARSPRGAWCYWMKPAHRALFARCRKLRDVAPPRQGLATTDNARFVRYWWEVEHGAARDTWFPYVKSGRFRRWYESPRHRVHWRDDGADIKRAIVERYPYLNGQWRWVAKNAQHYFKPGVTYSYLTSGQFSARRLDTGAIFDVAGSSLFPDDVPTMLAVLNSSVARELLGLINPTVNFQVGDLAELPIPAGSTDALRDDVMRAIELTREMDTFDETSPDFVAPEYDPEIARELSDVERRIDAAVSELYGCEQAANPTACREASDRSMPWRSFELTQRLEDADGPIELDAREHDLVAWHSRVYHRRPRIWVFGDRSSKLFAIQHHRATRDVVRWIARRLHQSAPRGWDRFIDDGIAVNLAPLHPIIADRALRRASKLICDEMSAGRFEWSQTARTIKRKRRSLVTSSSR